jgi:hypothetical protein
MKRWSLVLVLVLAGTAAAQKNTPFAPGCPLPFVPVSHDVDDRCGIEGSGGSNDKHRAASAAKKNI